MIVLMLEVDSIDNAESIDIDDSTGTGDSPDIGDSIDTGESIDNAESIVYGESGTAQNHLCLWDSELSVLLPVMSQPINNF